MIRKHPDVFALSVVVALCAWQQAAPPSSPLAPPSPVRSRMVEPTGIAEPVVSSVAAQVYGWLCPAIVQRFR